MAEWYAVLQKQYDPFDGLSIVNLVRGEPGKDGVDEFGRTPISREDESFAIYHTIDCPFLNIFSGKNWMRMAITPELREIFQKLNNGVEAQKLSDGREVKKLPAARELLNSMS